MDVARARWYVHSHCAEYLALTRRTARPACIQQPQPGSHDHAGVVTVTDASNASSSTPYRRTRSLRCDSESRGPRNRRAALLQDCRVRSEVLEACGIAHRASNSPLSEEIKRSAGGDQEVSTHAM